MGASVSCGQDTLAAESLFPLHSTLSLPLFPCPARPLVLTQGSLCAVSRTETRGERSEAAVCVFFSVHTHRCGTWERSVDIIVCACQMLGTFMCNGDKTAVLRWCLDEWTIPNPDWQSSITNYIVFLCLKVEALSACIFSVSVEPARTTVLIPEGKCGRTTECWI